MARAGSINLANLYEPDLPGGGRKRATDPSLGNGGGVSLTDPAGDTAAPGGRPPLLNIDQGGGGQDSGGGGAADVLDALGGAPDTGYDPMGGLGLTGGAENWTGADLGNDPGYQFRLSEAQRAQDRLNAQRGGFYSGDALKEALRLSQGMASDEAGNAFGRYNTQWNNNNQERQRLFDNWTGEDQRTWKNQFLSGQQQWENDYKSHDQSFNDWLNLAKLGFDATGKNTDTQASGGTADQQSLYDLINAYLASLGQAPSAGG